MTQIWKIIKDTDRNGFVVHWLAVVPVGELGLHLCPPIKLRKIR